MTADIILSASGTDRAAIDAVLAGLARDESGYGQPVLGNAISYALLGGGKRIRGRILLCSFRACRGRGDASALAAAVEIIHAYSLVHDDLPCMDDDDVRRGRPTLHRAFGVPEATAAGVLMIATAARVAAEGCATLGLPAPVTARIGGTLMSAAGAASESMIGGQLMDLDHEHSRPTARQLEAIHRAKTAALIEASAALGALAAGAPPDTVRALSTYGAELGLAFQIVDDILDVTASTAELGKSSRRDAILGKPTWPDLLGIEGARAKAEKAGAVAVAALHPAGVDSAELAAIVTQALERRS
ncbi:MAG: polyprenyl synthetase family protein [Gemmatimonadota bacterium]